MKKSINGNLISFVFEDGVEALTFDRSKLASNLVESAVMHGMMQRLGDAAAIARTKENGFTVTEAMRRAAVQELVAHYESGSTDWNLKTRTVRTVTKLNPLVYNLSVKRGITYEEAEVLWNNAAIAALMGE